MTKFQLTIKEEHDNVYKVIGYFDSVIEAVDKVRVMMVCNHIVISGVEIRRIENAN